VGLGILGGGVATARFLLRKGAVLTVTDKRDAEILAPSIAKLPKGVSYTIGKHIKNDFENADMVVANPAVSRFGEWMMYAESLSKKIYNDLTLFLTFFVLKKKTYIAVSGTRGKTTSSVWVNHFLPGSVLGGNIPEKGLLKILGIRGEPFVLETSSFQLEYITEGLLAPKIAFITNLYQDHLNRHGTMEEYARVKGGIFLNQSSSDYLVLNYENEWTKYFLSLNPKSRVYYISTIKLPNKLSGLYEEAGKVYFKEHATSTFIGNTPFTTDFENHNLLGALLTSFLYLRDSELQKKKPKADNILWKSLHKNIRNLPQAPMRREVILKKKGLLVINDSAGTSPDATLALLDSYRTVPKKELFLITGGTDKQLDYTLWAPVIKKNISLSNLYFLEGSATTKMLTALKLLFPQKTMPTFAVYPALLDIVKEIHERPGFKTVLFSPGSASFEKFDNEFDRGKIFSKLSNRIFGR